MKKRWAAKKGFTIIELLVVIVVIGILVGITLVSYSGIQQRSRDSTRGSDITQLKIAIEKYHADNSQYPAICGDDAGCLMTSLATPLLPYLSAIPRDPQYVAMPGNDYAYVRGPLINDSYAIKVVYEAKAVCKTGQNVNINWWGTALPIC